ncbi:MAG: triphosphoribosyl-dephospho-CoA synthase [Promethearchaeota archaeon]
MSTSPQFRIISPLSLLLTWKDANQWEFGHDKPGNVGPTNQSKGISIEDYQGVNEAIFSDLSRIKPDFSSLSLGKLILRSVSAMVNCLPYQNLFLGNILLVSPLLLAGSKLSTQHPNRQLFEWDEFWDQVQLILKKTTAQDTKDIIDAINRASPGGLKSPGGKSLSSTYDITKSTIEHQVTSQNLRILDLFRESAHYDTISAEWVSNYSLCKEWLKSFFDLKTATSKATNIQEYVLEMFLKLLATYPDSLIFRKNSRQISEEIQREAGTIVQAGSLFTSEGQKLLKAFKLRLDSSNGKLNPGTTADLIACLLFLTKLLGKLPEYFVPLSSK